ncbi:hypothetical protein [Chitinimonas koreensis]|uniref:hypothetical protein n=1 Tax=Chitinimonas koreensis TaxID=356302 RepID=UPI0003F570B2|nr:hypothetical protein [Chitinimonas koreensis]QNM95453.1 hypothetical protein H9L41_16495 [Chitinimonas koreensis]
MVIRTADFLSQFGLAMNEGAVEIANYERACDCYVHHSQVPVAVAGYALASPTFAQRQFPKFSFIDLIQKRPSMDVQEAVALAAVCGADVTPPFWGNGGPFGKHLWLVIERYRLDPFFERVDQPYGSDGDHYYMRPRGIDARTGDAIPEVLVRWREAYRKLDTPYQLMVATVLQLYRQGPDKHWMVRVPKTWHAAEGVQALRAAGFLADWARLVALYPGW